MLVVIAKVSHNFQCSIEYGVIFHQVRKSTGKYSGEKDIPAPVYLKGRSKV